MQEPWRFGEPYLTLAREALERRYRLLPTLYTLAHEAPVLGWPVLRPLVLYAPEDAEALHAADQFLLEKDLLVAPVMSPGKSRRLAYLPEGRWLSLPNLQGPGEVQEGGRHVIAEAPLGTVPVWLREGGAVALTEPALHTTTANWGQLSWHIHAAPEVEARLYEDAGEGYGDARLTRLHGRLEGGHLVLERSVEGTLPRARDVETLHVYGLPAPREAAGAQAHRVREGGLELTVEADWRRLEVRA